MNFTDVKSIFIPGLEPGGDVLSIADNNGTVMWEKSSGETYTLVEYIQGTGTQYIDTGLLHTSLNEIYTLTVSIDTLQQQNILFSNANDVAVNLYKRSTTSGTLYARYGQTTYTQRNNINPNNYRSKAPWRLQNGTLYRNNSAVVSPTRASTIPAQSGTLKLLTSDGGSCTRGKIYEFSVSISGNPTMDLVPAIRDSDGAVGMYDQINDVFYNNAGTGVFTAGNPI